MALFLACGALAQQRTQGIGVPTAVVGYQDVRADVSTVVSVATDEATETEVQLRFAGWIERVYANTTYARVQRGQPLLRVYSPDLYAAEQEYVFAARNRARLAASAVAGVAAGAASLLADARARLQQEQVPAVEIARLERSLRPRSRLTIPAPASGIVTERDALPNQRVEPGQRLFRIAALSPIWVNAEVNESDLGRVQVGQPVRLQFDAFPGRVFRAPVDFINPQVDAASRTARVRMVLANGDGALLPGMYGQARIGVALGRQLVIPASAVLQTGEQPLAFVDQGGGRLAPRKVELGPRVGDVYVLRGGLRAGERIARQASFLIASEEQLSAGAGSYAPPSPGVGAAVPVARAAGARLMLTTAPTPPQVGSNVFRVRLVSAAGAPLAGAQISLALDLPAMPAMGMAGAKAVVALTDQGGGLYEGRGRLGSTGTWQVTITATRQGQTVARQQMSLVVVGGMR